MLQHFTFNTLLSMIVKAAAWLLAGQELPGTQIRNRLKKYEAASESWVHEELYPRCEELLFKMRLLAAIMRNNSRRGRRNVKVHFLLKVCAPESTVWSLGIEELAQIKEFSSLTVHESARANITLFSSRTLEGQRRGRNIDTAVDALKKIRLNSERHPRVAHCWSGVAAGFTIC